MELILLFFFVIIFLLVMLSWVWPPDSPWAPWWRTNKKTALSICKLADIKKEDVVYDLGCGDGEVLLACAKIGARGVGVEIDPMRFIIAKIRVKLSGVEDKIKIKKKNLFKEDLSQASVIVVYLVPKALNQLVPKFKKELKKGTRIVSYKYEIEGLKLSKKDSKNNLILYVI